MTKVAESHRQYLAAVKLGHQAHAGQTYAGLPYTRHLAHVENVLHRFGWRNPDLLTAAWLHDALEDKTGVTVEQIGGLCGAAVAKFVTAVSDGEGRNRKERKQASYLKMCGHPESIRLKLADRIANVETCLIEGDMGLFQMYRKEHEEFRALLFVRSRQFVTEGLPAWRRVTQMWEYLDEIITPDAPPAA